MARYLAIVKWPLVILVANALVFGFVDSGYGDFGTILFNLVRVVVIVWAGWLLVEKAQVSVALASFIGPTFLFIDHVVLGGGIGLVRYEEDRGAFFGGILISYLMFFPVALLFSALGGYAAKGASGEAK